MNEYIKTPKEYANELFSRAYIILFDSDTDKRDEVLVSLLSKKLAIMNVQDTKAMIDFLYDTDCDFGEIMEIHKYLDETIKEIEIL